MSSGYLKDNSRNLPPIGQSKTSINPRLEDLEKKISRNFLEAAEALREIHDEKLYLAYFETFKEYCEKRLGRSIRAVQEQLKMLEISKQLEPQKSDANLDHSSSNAVHNVHEGPLPLKDLRKKARIPTKKSQAKPKVPEPMNRITDEDRAAELWADIERRLRKKSKNLKFLEALDEWLTGSGL